MKGPAEAPVLRGKGLRGRGDGDLPRRRSPRLVTETTNESLLLMKVQQNSWMFV